MSDAYLTNQLLIAMPTLDDPNFAHSVTLICEHTAKGALGIVINRPLKMSLGDIFAQLSLDTMNSAIADQPVLFGGPVQRDRGFVLHPSSAQTAPAWESSLQVSPTLQVTTSRDILSAIARGDGPSRAVIALGYAGWEAGQLEDEIRANAWLNVPNDTELLFETPFNERWHAAAKRLGIDFGRLSPQAGHA
jgi:putative transcriptional regulator